MLESRVTAARVHFRPSACLCTCLLESEVEREEDISILLFVRVCGEGVLCFTGEQLQGCIDELNKCANLEKMQQEVLFAFNKLVLLKTVFISQISLTFFFITSDIG